MILVDFKGLHRDLVVLLHDPHELVHGRSHAVFGRQACGAVSETRGNRDILDLVAKDFLHAADKAVEGFGVVFGQGSCLGRAFFLVGKVLEILLGSSFDGLEIPVLILAKTLHAELIHWLVKEEDFNLLLAEEIHVRVQECRLSVRGGHVPERLLAGQGSGHILIKAAESLLIIQFGGIEAHQAGNAFAVGEVLIAELEDAAVILPELFVDVRFFLGQLLEVAESLLDYGLIDLSEDPVLLQCFT